jgi:hypothetical protein
MANFTRLDFDEHYGVVKSSDGDFVSYEDYKELEKQLAQANYDLGMTQINLESQTRLLGQCTMALTRSNDALVESVPKSEIIDAMSRSEEGRRHIGERYYMLTKMLKKFYSSQ